MNDKKEEGFLPSQNLSFGPPLYKICVEDLLKTWRFFITQKHGALKQYATFKAQDQSNMNEESIFRQRLGVDERPIQRLLKWCRHNPEIDSEGDLHKRLDEDLIAFENQQMRLEAEHNALQKEREKLVDACNEVESALEKELIAAEDLARQYEAAKKLREEEIKKNEVAERIVAQGLRTVPEYQDIIKVVQESIESTQTSYEAIENLWAIRKKVFDSLVENIETARPVIAQSKWRPSVSSSAQILASRKPWVLVWIDERSLINELYYKIYKFK